MERTDTIITLSFGDKSNAITKRLLEEASVIEFNKCSFVYNKEGDFYHPVEGDINILGIHIPIQEMTFEMLFKLISSLEADIRLVFYKKYDTDISNINYVSRIDYTETLNFLNKKGIVFTKESKSFIATDPRVFSFNNQDWYEADILGTPLGKEQTERLVQEYKNIN